MAPNPYLSAAGFTRRTVMPSGDVSLVQTSAPGFLELRLRRIQSWINDRLRKRYARSLPFGEAPAPLAIAGASGPLIVLSGVPSAGDLEIWMRIATAGPVSTAVFDWSSDGGLTWTSGVATASTVSLGSTGLLATFPDGAYGTFLTYAASTPVPDTVLAWMTTVVTPDMYRKRGVDPQDPTIVQLEEDRKVAIAEVLEAADSETSKFDLPTNDMIPTGTAISSGGPYAYSEQSPWTWTDRQVEAVRGR